MLFCIILLRFFSIQATGKVAGISIAKIAAQKYLYSEVLSAKRGTIYDNNGNVIAEDETTYKMIAVLDKKQPNHITNPEKTALELSKYIKLPKDKILLLLKKKGRFQVEFGNARNNLHSITKKKIEGLKLSGLMFIGSTTRYYPNGIFSSNLIGYAETQVLKDGSFQQTGKMGIEKELNKELQGTSGSLKYDQDRWGTILPDSIKFIKKPKNCDDIYLTIDKNIQIFLENAMDVVNKKYKPTNMVAIVEDPKNGKILAMAQRPTFNLDTKEGINSSWENLAVENSYEPGSGMKIITLAAAVQQGVFIPNATYKSGKFYVKGVPSPIKDWNSGVGWGEITFLAGLQKSSNVAFATLLNKIGQDKFLTYLNSFHLGRETKVGLPNETSGKILYNWPIEKYTTAFGQGTTVTAIQMIQAASAVANNGRMMKPYVVDKIVNPNTGKVKTNSPHVVGNPISSDTANQVRQYLRTVVSSKDGTGRMYDITGYDVAGKTGTAQIAGKDGKYLTGLNNYIFSFLVFAPVDNPKLVVYVAIQQPQLNQNSNESGSNPVQMLFNPVMKNSLDYLRINTDTASKTKSWKSEVPDLMSISLKESEKKLRDKGFQVVVLGRGDTVVGQLPNKMTPLLEGEKVMLLTNGNPLMPNMKNWSRREIMMVSNLLGLNVEIKGNGYLTKQSISANTPVKKGDSIWFTLETLN